MLRTLTCRDYPEQFRETQIHGPEKAENPSWLWSEGDVTVEEGSD